MLEAGLGNRFVPIRRDQLLFDGFDRLNSLGERLRGRVRIMFIDAHGQPEAGVVGAAGAWWRGMHWVWCGNGRRSGCGCLTVYPLRVKVIARP